MVKSDKDVSNVPLYWLKMDINSIESSATNLPLRWKKWLLASKGIIFFMQVLGERIQLPYTCSWKGGDIPVHSSSAHPLLYTCYCFRDKLTANNGRLHLLQRRQRQETASTRCQSWGTPLELWRSGITPKFSIFCRDSEQYLLISLKFNRKDITDGSVLGIFIIYLTYQVIVILTLSHNENQICC